MFVFFSLQVVLTNVLVAAHFSFVVSAGGDQIGGIPIFQVQDGDDFFQFIFTIGNLLTMDNLFNLEYPFSC